MREADADPLLERSDPRYVRAQALTLFMGAYDECRRGVNHLRWHEGDAAEIVPSLYRGRGGRRVVVDEDEVVDDVVDAGAMTEPEDLSTPVPVTVPTADAVVTA